MNHSEKKIKIRILNNGLYFIQLFINRVNYEYQYESTTWISND